MSAPINPGPIELRLVRCNSPDCPTAWHVHPGCSVLLQTMPDALRNALVHRMLEAAKGQPGSEVRLVLEQQWTVRLHPLEVSAEAHG